MPQTIKFHLDENVNPAIARGLRIHGIDVTTTPEMGLLQASDEKQIEFAKEQGRVFFTHDDDFLGIQAGHAGIVYCGQGRCAIGQIIRWLILIWEALDPADMQNDVEFI